MLDTAQYLETSTTNRSCIQTAADTSNLSLTHCQMFTWLSQLIHQHHNIISAAGASHLQLYIIVESFSPLPLTHSYDPLANSPFLVKIPNLNLVKTM